MRNSLKRLIIVAVLAIASVSITVNVMSAVDNITVIVNGQEVLFPDQRPVIVEDRTLVPVRGVFEAIGFVVDWDEETSTALLSDSEGVFNITIQIGEPHFSVGVFNPDMPVGHANIVALDVPAQIIGGRTMLPLRAVLESVGYQFDWDETTRTVNITSASEIDSQQQGQTVLPFNDGTFIITSSYFDEHRDVWFRFSEGRENFDDYNGVFFEADNFHSHATAFVNTMNQISPTLVDYTTTEILDNPPFDEVTHDNYLYRLQISEFFIRMSVIEFDDYGLLYFYIFDAETIQHPDHTQVFHSDKRHHSLYRITLDDLDQIVRFAERLNRSERMWTATPAD